MRVEKIRKRDGRIVAFEKPKISSAIYEAMKATGYGSYEDAVGVSDKICGVLDATFGSLYPPSVEQVQDIVEQTLAQNGFYPVAKNYIIYREHRRKAREMDAAFLNQDTLIRDFLGETDWMIKRNANVQYSFSNLTMHLAESAIRTYALNHLYSKDAADAHKDGHIYIHNLGGAIVGYCAGWGMEPLLMDGLADISRPAKHFDTLISQMVNFIGVLQNEWNGAMAMPFVDVYLAPFVRADNMSYEQVKQGVQQFVYGCNITTRWGQQSPFSNVNFAWKIPSRLEESPVIIGGETNGGSYLDYVEEIETVNRAFIEVFSEGDKRGAPFTFPIPTYHITKDFDWKSENAERLMKLAAKYGTPYFLNFVGSGIDPDSVFSMCCRLSLDMKQLEARGGGLFGSNPQTGSIGVVDVNLNRVAYESHGSEDTFFELLDRYLVLAKQCLEAKREVVSKNLEHGLMPYSKMYLPRGFELHFSTIGVVGGHEAMLNLIDPELGIAGDAGRDFCSKTLDFIRGRLVAFQEETGNLYNLEATPNEQASYHLALLDRKHCPDIVLYGEREPMLTNSTQLPSDFSTDVAKAVRHQERLQPKYTGGTVFHTYLEKRFDDWEACRIMLRHIVKESKLPNITMTPTVGVCPSHGYQENGSSCPKCGVSLLQFSRVVGYYRPVSNWNRGKQEEFRLRKFFEQEMRGG